MNTLRPILGIDFGGVINDGASHPSGDDTAFLSGGYEAAMSTPIMKGAVDLIARLSRALQGRVWVISKCGPRIQERTEQWLRFHNFFEQVGVNELQIRFCRHRAEKAIHCRDLGVTHFVDDRSDVLDHLVGIVEYRFLFGSRGASASRDYIRVKDWSEAERRIFETMSQ